MALTLDGIKKPRRKKSKSTSTKKKKKPLAPFKTESNDNSEANVSLQSSSKIDPRHSIDSPFEASNTAERVAAPSPSNDIKTLKKPITEHSDESVKDDFDKGSIREQAIEPSTTDKLSIREPLGNSNNSLSPTLLVNQHTPIREPSDNNRGTIREQNEHTNKNKISSLPNSKGNNKGSDSLESEDSFLDCDHNQIREPLGSKENDSENKSFNSKGNHWGAKRNSLKLELKHEPKSKQGTIGDQLGNRRGSIGEQLGSWEKYKTSPLDNNKGTDKGTNKGTKDNEVIIDLDPSYLVGNESKFVKFIFLKCLQAGSFITGPITNKAIVEHLNVSTEVAKMVIKRTIKKGYLQRAGGKRGNGGFTKFSINQSVYQKLLVARELNISDSNIETPSPALGSNKGANRGTDKGANSSSKLVTNKKETNFTNRKEEMFSFYENVDFSLLDTTEALLQNRLNREKIIGEIAKNEWNIKPFDLEEIISKFASYVSNKDNVYNVRSIQGFFFSQLKKQHQGDFLDIEGVDSEHDQNLIEMKKRMLAEKARREDMKAEIMDLAFEAWWDLSNREEQEELSPGAFKLSSDPEIIRRGVKGAWMEQIWPQSIECKELIATLKSMSSQNQAISKAKIQNELENAPEIEEKFSHE